MNEFLVMAQRCVEEAKALYNRGLAIQTKATEESRNITTEELAQIEKWFSDSADKKAEADKLFKIGENQKAVSAIMNLPSAVLGHDEPAGDRLMKSVTDKMARDYFSSKSESAWAEARAMIAKRGEMEKKTLTRLSDVDGGFLLTPEYSNTLLTELRNMVYFMDQARVVTTSRSEWVAPTWDHDESMPHVQENADAATEDYSDAVGQFRLRPASFGRVVKVPLDLLDDVGFDLFGHLITMFSQRTGELMENHFLNGTGSNQPLGLLAQIASTDIITGVDVATATSAEIVVGDVQALPYSLKAQYRQNGRFMMSRAYMKKAMLLRTDDGGSGTGRYMWQPSFQAGQPALLAGYPVMETEYWPVVDADGDPVMLFGDFKQYYIALRTPFSWLRLNERYAEYDQVGIKIKMRYDGKPFDKNAFVRLNRT